MGPGRRWRSDDGGENWKLVSYDRNLSGRTHYYSRFAVAPDDHNEAYFLSAAYVVSLDGGETTVAQTGTARPGGDNHDMWIDPTNGNRMIVGNDGAWSQIARGQVEILGDDVATVLARTAYHEVAAGYGGEGLLLERPEDAADVLARAKSLAASGRPVCGNAMSGATDFRQGSLSV